MGGAIMGKTPNFQKILISGTFITAGWKILIIKKIMNNKYLRT